MNKQIITPILLAIVTMSIATKAYSQDVNTCQTIAERILTAAQNHSSDGIDELLAPEFHFSNIKQPIAGKVLKQIIAQMPIITGWEQSDVERDNTGLTLHYIMSTRIHTKKIVDSYFDSHPNCNSYNISKANSCQLTHLRRRGHWQ